MGTLHEDLLTNVMSGCILLIMRNVVDKRCRENQNILCSKTYFSWKSYRLWDNV